MSRHIVDMCTDMHTDIYRDMYLDIFATWRTTPIVSRTNFSALVEAVRKSTIPVPNNPCSNIAPMVKTLYRPV